MSVSKAENPQIFAEAIAIAQHNAWKEWNELGKKFKPQRELPRIVKVDRYVYPAE
jgi:hypothetical protein